MQHAFAHAIERRFALAYFRIYGPPKCDESLTNTSTRMLFLAVKFGNLHARERQFLLQPHTMPEQQAFPTADFIFQSSAVKSKSN